MPEAETHLTPKTVSSIFKDMEAMQKRIMDRAYELFCERGRQIGRELEDWFTAEREVTWSPAIEVREREDEYIVEAAVPGVDPKDLEIEISSDDLLIRAEVGHEHEKEKGDVRICEFRPGPLFRSIHFSRHIDPEKTSAELKNGLLKIHIGILEASRAKKVEVQAA